MLIHPKSLIYTTDGCLTSRHLNQPDSVQLVNLEGKPLPLTSVSLEQEPDEYVEAVSRYGTFYLDPNGYVAVLEDASKITLKRCDQLTAVDILINIPHPPKRPSQDSWKAWWLRGYFWVTSRSTVVSQQFNSPYQTLITEALYELRFFTASQETPRGIKWHLNAKPETDESDLYQLNELQLRSFLAGARLASRWKPDSSAYQMALSGPVEKLTIAQKLYLRLGIHTSLRYGSEASLNEPTQAAKKKQSWLQVEGKISQQIWLALIGTFLAEDPFLPTKTARLTHGIPHSMTKPYGALMRSMTKPTENHIDWVRLIQEYMVFTQWLPIPLKGLKRVAVETKAATFDVHAPQPFLVDGILVASADNLPPLPEVNRNHAYLRL